MTVFYDVSCATINDCLAVGEASSTNDGIIYRTTDGGLNWTLIQDLPNSGSNHVVFRGVDCLSNGQNCHFVGQNGLTPYIEFTPDLGTTLQPETLPALYTEGTLDHVSCWTASDCVAVDSFDHNTAIVTTHNGSSWAQTLTTTGAGTTQLLGVSCPSSVLCLAVGWDGHTTAEAWASTDGGDTWTQRTVPGNASPALDGVGCSSAAYCVLGGAATLETIDGGASWISMVQPPSFLYDFSCLAVDECMGTGQVVSSWSVRSATTIKGSVSPKYGLSTVKASFSASLSSVSGTPVGQLTATLGGSVKCAGELAAGKGACTSANGGKGTSTFILRYGGNDLYLPSSTSVTQTIGSGPACSKLSSSTSKVLTFSKCSPTSAGYGTINVPTSTITGLAATPTGKAKFTWKSSGKTFYASLAATAEGQGSCSAGHKELLVTGKVTLGGSSKKPLAGDGIGMQVCVTSKTATLAFGTKADF